MKYLIMEDFSGQPVCFLFPRRVSHVDLREQLPYSKIVSAGYVELDGANIKCSGGCVEYNVMASDEDAKIIHQALQEQSV